ncbi:HNH endonuclease signature motif containing protein [Arthrobacter sp. Z4-13]
MEAMGDQLAEYGSTTAVLTRAGSSPGRGPQAYDDDSRLSPTGHLRVVPARPAPHDDEPDEAVPADAVRGEAAPADAVRGEAAPADAVRGEAAPADAVRGEAPPADAVLAEAVPLAPVAGASADAAVSLAEICRLLAAAAAAAPSRLAAADYVEAADFAGQVEELSRGVEYLQILAAGVVDRTRARAIADAGTARACRSRTGKNWVTGWDNGVETLDETDAAWPEGAAASGSTASGPTTSGSVTSGSVGSGTGAWTDRQDRVVTSPADDGCANTAEFLRQRLRIGKSEAHRRLALAADILPATTLTGDTTPAPREHLAAALAPTPATNLDNTGTSTGTGTDDSSTGSGPNPDDRTENTAGTNALTAPGQGPASPAVSSRAGTIISLTLNRLQHLTTPEKLALIEENLTTTAATTDPDFLARVARRWADTIDADGTEPSEETLRHTQGAFIRKPRHGLHHLEIFATTDQYEHLLTVMNTATNPRTTTGTSTAPTGTRTGSGSGSGSGSGTGLSPWHDGEVELDRRTRPQKQLDGLVGAAKVALATNTLPNTGGNRPQIIATINYQDLLPHRTGTNYTGNGGTRTGTGTATNTTTTNTNTTGTGTGNFVFTGPVAAAALRKLACDADIIPAVLGTHGELLDLGRKARLFTTAQRLALTARDQGCTFPNCTIPAPWCEAHHITYWSHGGPTTTDNGALLCSAHHHLIHKEQWTITTINGTPWYTPPKHLDPHQKPQQNNYFKPPPPPCE